LLESQVDLEEKVNIIEQLKEYCSELDSKLIEQKVVLEASVKTIEKLKEENEQLTRENEARTTVKETATVASTNGTDSARLLSTRAIASIIMIGLITIVTGPTFVRHTSNFIFQPLSTFTSTSETTESSVSSLAEEGMIKFGRLMMN
jgi:hypothetical protein